MFSRMATPQADYGLSERERQILQQLVEGLTKQQASAPNPSYIAPRVSSASLTLASPTPGVSSGNFVTTLRRTSMASGCFPAS
jgi:hypothetical protein